jgi:hypothetical protein
MPPILLGGSTTSEADVGDMAVEVETSRQYSVQFGYMASGICFEVFHFQFAEE